MKQSDNLLYILFFSFLFYSIVYSQNSTASNQYGSGTDLKLTDDYVVINYDGANYTSIGDTGTTFIGGVKFRNNPLAFYTGNVFVYVQFFYAQPATGLTVLIYDAGTPNAPGPLLLSQHLNPNYLSVGNWNQITLYPGVVISGDDMWVCIQVEDSTAAYSPLGCDAGPAVQDGDWINNSGTWQHLTDFGLNYNWNIRGVIFAQPVAGPVIFYDNFDSYIPGQQLACQNPAGWTTWNLNPCDSIMDTYISDNHAYSDSNSFVVVPGNDEVHYWGPETSGVWEIEFYNYIPSGKTGYFNILASFIGNQEWGLEVFFNTTLQSYINAGGISAAWFSCVPDTWILNRCIIDLNNNIAQYRYNGALIYMWQWTQGANGFPIALSLAASDFFGYSSTDEMYVDDYQFRLLNMYLVPAELTSFTANTNASGEVALNWQTATETNNKGFEVERQICSRQYAAGKEWEKIGFVNGNGTTTEMHTYSFIDKNAYQGTFKYRLKQIDFNGTYNYSNEITADIAAPMKYSLEQNFPNPFNPATTIKFTIPKEDQVNLSIYDILGEKVKELKNEVMKPGYYEVNFNAAAFASGVYFYRIKAGDFIQTKKMNLLK